MSGYAPTYLGLTWTASELIAEVRDVARIPDGADTDFSNAKILAFADQAIRSLMSELQVSSPSAGRWLDYNDVLASEGFRNGLQFLVPAAAASGNISHVDYYPNANGHPYRLFATTAPEAIEVEEADSGSRPSHWYFHDGRVVLLPSTVSHGDGARVRVWFPRVHPRMVQSSEVGDVSVVDIGTDGISLLLQHPAGWPSPPYAVDLYSGRSPHTVLLSRLVVTDDSGNGGTLLTYTPPITGEEDLKAATFESGTKVALSGQSDSVQLPDSYRRALTQRVASDILRTIGDVDLSNSMLGTSREDMASVANQLIPRMKGQTSKIINRHSALRGRGRGRYGWGRW